MTTSDKAYFDKKAAELAAEAKRCGKVAAQVVVAQNAASNKKMMKQLGDKIEEQAKATADLAKTVKGVAKVQGEQGKKLDAIQDGITKIANRQKKAEIANKFNGLVFTVAAIIGVILGVLLVVALIQPTGWAAWVAYIGIPLLTGLGLGLAIEVLYRPDTSTGGTP